MATGNTEAPPAFVGKINVTSTNNELYVQEETGGLNINATVGIDEYWPSDLADAMKTALDAASLASGNTLTYTVEFSVETGKFTISATGNFRLRIHDMSLAGQLLTGGNEDDNGNLFGTGDYGTRFLGFPVTASVGSYSDSFTSPNQSASYWSPSMPVASNPGPQYQSRATQALALDGSAVCYDYVPGEIDSSDYRFPYPSSPPHTIPLGFRLLTSADRQQYIALFWAPYAKEGKVFRFYEERDQASFGTYILDLPNMQQSGFPSRRPGYPRYQTTLVLRSQSA